MAQTRKFLSLFPSLMLAPDVAVVSSEEGNQAFALHFHPLLRLQVVLIAGMDKGS